MAFRAASRSSSLANTSVMPSLLGGAAASRTMVGVFLARRRSAGEQEVGSRSLGMGRAD
jgi:hypothetical protein